MVAVVGSAAGWAVSAGMSSETVGVSVGSGGLAVGSDVGEFSQLHPPTLALAAASSQERPGGKTRIAESRLPQVDSRMGWSGFKRIPSRPQIPKQSSAVGAIDGDKDGSCPATVCKDTDTTKKAISPMLMDGRVIQKLVRIISSLWSYK